MYACFTPNKDNVML